MIIYGWGSTKVAEQRGLNTTCPNCKEKGNMAMAIFSKHTHIFWIPLFPYGKTGLCQCANCDFYMEGKDQMTEEVLREYQILKSDSRPPIWQFAGLAIVAILFGTIFISDQMDNQELQSSIETPMVGDVFRYETEDNGYSTFKIVQTEEDSVWLLYNNWITDQRTSVDELTTDTAFTDLYYQMSRDELKAMHAKGSIYAVNRTEAE